MKHCSVQKITMKCWLLNDIDMESMFKKTDSMDEFYVQLADAVGHLPEWCELVNILDMYIEVDNDNRDTILYKGKRVRRPDVALCFYLGGTSFGVNVNDNLHLRILDQLQMLGTHCIQSSVQLANTSDKLKCSQILAAAGIRVPSTLLVTDAVTPSYLVEKLGLPVVVKPNDGTEGIGVRLIKTEEELKDIIEHRDKKSSLLAQQYISTSCGRDLRIAMLGDEVLYAMERDNTRNGDFRSNISQGGTVHVFTPPADALELARKAMKTLGLNLCSVDLLYGEDCYYVGEVNSIPGYEHGQTYEGEDVTSRYKRLLAEYVRKVIR